LILHPETTNMKGQVTIKGGHLAYKVGRSQMRALEICPMQKLDSN
jgi:hypothetical protein